MIPNIFRIDTCFFDDIPDRDALAGTPDKVIYLDTALIRERHGDSCYVHRRYRSDLFGRSKFVIVDFMDDEPSSVDECGIVPGIFSPI